jgi:hypothetical protein
MIRPDQGWIARNVPVVRTHPDANRTRSVGRKPSKPAAVDAVDPVELKQIAEV